MTTMSVPNSRLGRVWNRTVDVFTSPKSGPVLVTAVLFLLMFTAGGLRYRGFFSATTILNLLVVAVIVHDPLHRPVRELRADIADKAHEMGGKVFVADPGQAGLILPSGWQAVLAGILQTLADLAPELRG